MRVHGELEQASLAKGRLQFTAKDVKDIGRCGVGAQRGKAVHVEVDRVVANPLDRQLDNTGWGAIEHQLVAIHISHER